MLLGLALLGLVFGVSRPAGAGKPPVPSSANQVFLPLAEFLVPVYLPLMLNQPYVPVSLVNGSFEADTLIDFIDFPNAPCRYSGVTDQPKGNQHPSGWTFYSPAAGQPLPFPTKMQQGTVVSATSGGPGEYVHKCWWQLPTEERLNEPRALILDGNWTYKVFNSGSPQALVLSQVLSGTPGLRLEVTGYILGETPDTPTGPKLEDDHFIASVQLGSTKDTRFYATMITHSDVGNNERHWNKYDVSAIVPASGQLQLTIIMQQNWAGEVDFFIDNFSAFELPSN
jgi:hypothetical protein